MLLLAGLASVALSNGAHAAAIQNTPGKIGTRGMTVQRADVTFDQQVYRRRVALCVGINNYASYPELEAAMADAESMSSLFENYGFDEVVTILDRDATKRKVVDELLRLKVESDPDDLFVFYFAGHGQTVKREDGGEEGYLIPIDCTAGKETEQGISMGLFKDIADTMQNRHVLFLVDSCYSGYGLTRSARGMNVQPAENRNEALDYLTAMLPKRSVQILTAGGKEDQAHESAGHGVFTRYVMETLAGRKDLGSSGIIGASELYGTVKREVVRETKGVQNPNFGYLYGDGDVVFVIGQEKRKRIEAPRKPTETASGLFARLDREFEEVKRLSEVGEWEKAERIMSRVYREYTEAGTPDSDKRREYLKTLLKQLSQMRKYDLLLFYAQQLAEQGQDELDRALGYSYEGEAIAGKARGSQKPGTICAEAEQLYKRALAIYQRTLGPDHPTVAARLSDLAGFYYRQGHFAEAEPLYRSASAIYEKTLGPDHPNFVASLINAGSLSLSRGYYDQAELSYKRALAISEKVPEPNPSDMTLILLGLAEAYDGQDDFAAADPLYRRALALFEKMHGADHPDMAHVLIRVADAGFSRGQYAEAEGFYRQALAIREKALGTNHLDVADTLYQIGFACSKQGRDPEARALFKRAGAIRRAQ